MLGGFQRLYHEALSKCRSDEERKQLNENPLSESILQSIRSNYEGLSDIEQRKSYKTYQSVIYVPFEKLKAGELKDFVNAYSAVYQARGIDRKFAANLELAASRAVALSRSARNGGAQGASKKLNYIFPRGFTRGLSLAISSEKIYDSYMRSRKDELGEQVKAHPEWYSKMKFDKMLDYDILPDIELITLNEVDLCADFVSDFIDNAHQEHAEVNMGEALDNTLSIPDLKEVLRHEDKYRNEQGNIQMAFDIS